LEETVAEAYILVYLVNEVPEGEAVVVVIPNPSLESYSVQD
jgi:hypothetical protein